jgi:acyl carrier protein
MSAIDDRIREVLKEHGRLPFEVGSLRDDDDLYEHGLTSHASVNIMLALEDEFGIEFPDVLLRKGTFESIAAIRSALVSLGAEDS